MRLRATSLLLFGLAAIAAWSCGRSGVPELDGVTTTPGTSPTATPDPTPTIDPDVRFTSVTSTVASVRPGQFGIVVDVVLENAGPVPIERVFASLTFSDAAGPRPDEVEHREADRREGQAFGPPPPRAMVAGTSMTLRFVMDVMPWVRTDDLRVNATATFRRTGNGEPFRVATPSFAPLSLAVPDVVEHVVNQTADEDDGGGDNDLSLREALLDAQESGVHRIRFDPLAFPPGAPARITLDDTLSTLPPINQTVILDGHGAGVEIEADPSLSDERRYGVDLRGPGIVVSEIHFVHPSLFFPIETLTNNCGANGPTGGDGAVIRIDSGATDVLLFRNTFFDGPGVIERSCFPAIVRIVGGTGHRVIGNDFYDLGQDALYLTNTTVREITGNRFAVAAGSTIADDGIYIADLNGDLFVVGNLLVGHEFSAIVANGAVTETVSLLHNTFASNLSSGINRAGVTRPLFLRNNIWAGNEPSNVTGANTANLDFGYELIFDDDPLCSACGTGNNTLTGDPMFAIAGSNSWAAMTPMSGSPAIDSGRDLIDRNGSVPGRYSGSAPDRGAVEVASD